MEITKEDRVGHIATKHPLATRIFARHDIDFCCGGGIALKDVCTKRDLDVENIVNELNKEIEKSSTDDNISWDEASPELLIEHILEVHHRPLDEELPRLAQMTAKVFEVHQDKDPKLGELLKTYNDLRAELEQHMMKEEQILFPMIKNGNGAQTGAPINVMHMEHESAGEALRKIRGLTNDFKVPEGACNTWRALWHGLEALEKDLHLHIHLENNILFPKALGTYENAVDS